MTHDRHWIINYASIVMLVTTIPYITGYTVGQLNPLDKNRWEFTGFVLGVEDGNSYIAKELLGSAGNWLFRTPYTTIPQSGVIAFLPYILLGKLASPPGLHIQLVVLFHLFRCFAGFLAIMATYDFLAVFIKQPRYLKIGVVIATIGGGLGWLWVLLGHETLFGSIPLEFYSPETFGFLSLYSLPHISLARTFLLWGLKRYLVVIQNEPFIPKDGLRIGVYWLLVSLAQPITAVVFGLVLGIYIFLSGLKQFIDNRRANPVDHSKWQRGLATGFLAGLIPAPFLLYNFYKFTTDNYLVTWTEQNRITSPHFFHYLSAYGLLLPLAVIGGIYLYKQNRELAIFLGGWVLAFPVLAYLPIGVQRRLVEAVWVAIVALSISGMISLRSSISGKKIEYIFFLIAGFSVISSIFVISFGFLAILRPGLPVYRRSEEVEAFEYLAAKSKPGDVVLSSYQTGNALPAWANVRVVIGHGPESANLEMLRDIVRRFYSLAGNDQEKLNFIRVNNIKFIFYGPEERSLGGWNPSDQSYLHSVYSSTNYEIFQTTLTP